MLLDDLISDVKFEKQLDKTISHEEVDRITDNSSNIKEGFLFVAIKGH